MDHFDVFFSLSKKIGSAPLELTSGIENWNKMKNYLDELDNPQCM